MGNRRLPSTSSTSSTSAAAAAPKKREPRGNGTKGKWEERRGVERKGGEGNPHSRAKILATALIVHRAGSKNL